MHQYLFELNTKMHHDLIASVLQDLKDVKLNNNVLNGFIYIASSDLYMKEDRYKIGSTINLDTRIINLNTSRDINDSLIILKSYAVSMHRQCEKLVHAALDKYRVSKNREFFTIKYDELIQIMDNLLLNN